MLQPIIPPSRLPWDHDLGRKLFEPADDKFWQAVRREDPELFKSIKPWNRIVEPDPLRALLVECGVTDPVVVAEPGTHLFDIPED
ncbi:MAG TPA: hypothetical protein VGY91_05400 [Chthoniobacterales bacterium]|jgi:hypothetical protein|nr:hypothetical protein [Chthoniobacterales bacterium]